jgi:DNA-nicking Smr family endonuclease
MASAQTTPQKPPLPPLAPLERRLRTRLKRGQEPIEAVLDLHGLRQDEAHGALVAFLQRKAAQGARLVLVVTGKGGGLSADGRDHVFQERGVLRRNVPHWLRMAELRPLVLGFEEADAAHGGAGALYVRLRRRREAAQ